MLPGMKKQNLHMCKERRHLISSVENKDKKFAAHFSECRFGLYFGCTRKDLLVCFLV